ncbi:hypothetical protein HYH03_003386 [Edaphochlamys debaryana]|uniref:Uncharacterized protein n=1 Tax=Edaphochlamys debaryana TaxID=47281 RepID=A0A836C4D2_9CHLO|nr:hypothetical protein HYH03_003386 [Edaphochlamys debaryana]|eukprot:KAG2498639.1 hypothetical protein HYH03_003386 [Edaphochlamys debaryana]
MSPALLPTAAHRRALSSVVSTSTRPTPHARCQAHKRPEPCGTEQTWGLSDKLRALALAAAASAALVFGPCDTAEAARSGGRIGGRHTTHLARKRAVASRASGTGLGSHRLAKPRRYRVPMSLRIRARTPAPGGPLFALPWAAADPSPAAAAAVASRPPLLIGDMLAYPDLAAGLDLEALPLPVSLLGLAVANLAGLALTIAVLRNLQDGSEPVSVVKVQVALLERRPQLQSKLAELNSMIQVGQQGTWLILEEAIMEVLNHQSRIAYGSVSSEELTSKKQAYTLFGSLAETEARKARREEMVVRHIGETTDEDEAPGGDDGGGLLGGMLRGLADRFAAHPAKELTIVTLVVAVRGRFGFHGADINDWAGLRGVLQQLTGLSSDKIMAIELLWTPQRETDYLTRAQLENDYPGLLPMGPAMEEGREEEARRGAAAK